jgi:aryl-alcohol dehydrogenase-like predicted oxidoreductase
VRSIEWDVLPVCDNWKMGVIAWSPLAGGWLAGKYRRGQEPPRDSRAVRYAERGSPLVRRYDQDSPENQRKFDLVEDLTVLADKAGISLTHLALAFVLAHPTVTSAIVGPRTPQQLEDLLAGADVRLGGETLDAIDELVPPGTVVNEADRGWAPPWMEPGARRR